MDRVLSLGAVLLSFAAAVNAASAQEEAPSSPAPAETSEPAGSAAGAPTDAIAETDPLPAPVQTNACVPECRTGFVCVEGQCVSACNPPCAQNERCTAAAQCAPLAPQPALGPVPPPPAPPPAPSPIPPAPRPSGAERHDGFMLRLTFGFGGAGTEADAPGLASDAEWSGFGTTFSLDAGGSPIENLVIHGRLASTTIVDPESSGDGAFGATLEDLSITAGLLGPAVTYYFMPLNAYVTLAVGLSGLQFSDGGRDFDTDTDTGLGFNLDGGKEWWVSDDWALGAALRLWYSRTNREDPLTGADVTYDFGAVSVLFSATYQ